MKYNIIINGVISLSLNIDKIQVYIYESVLYSKSLKQHNMEQAIDTNNNESIGDSVEPVMDTVSEEERSRHVEMTRERRQFVDLAQDFPEPCQRVLEDLGQVYKHDAQAKDLELSPQARLSFHQQHSQKVRISHFFLGPERSR